MRKKVGSEQNIWINSQQVDDDNLNLEQNYTNNKLSSIIDNHIGSGILPENIVQKVLFDSSLVSGNLDGTPLEIQAQPSDSNYGNQLEVKLENSKVFGLRSVKIAVFGLDYANSLIYESFTFYRNESQIGKLHFKNLLSILVNDISGPTNLSLNLGGTFKISEAKPAYLSRDSVYGQNIQPNLFWKYFFPVYSSTLNDLLSAALINYDIDQLNIYTEENSFKELAKNDITTEVGQKFKLSSDNIQKIRLLLSVENNDPGDETDLEWNGDLILTIYPLQSSITCPTDLAPNLEIEFDPTNAPLAQISFNFSSLKANGFVLSNTYQPVDFVFSNSNVAKNLTKDKYYAFTIKRSGTADKCDIKIYTGQNLLENSRITVFNGNYWSDIESEDFWFEIYSDSAKVASGSLYEDGFGIEIEKIKTDENTGVTSNYVYNGFSFSGNDIFTGILYSKNEYFEEIEDTRTGSKTKSKQKKVPEVELLSTTEINALENSSLLKIGVISDKNKKYQSSLNPEFKIYNWSFVKNEIIIPIIEDNTDPRYDEDVLALKAAMLNGELFKAKIIPDSVNTNLYYRIGEAKLIDMIYGDANGDCIVDESDLDFINLYKSFNLNVSPPLNSSIVLSPVSYENGYNFLTEKSVTKSNLQFYLIKISTNAVITTASDGVLVSTSGSNNYSQFSSSTVDFISNIDDTSDYIIYVVDTENGNNGYFNVSEVNSTNDVVTIYKKYLDSDVMLSLLRCNVNGDFLIDSDDGYLIENYLIRNEITSFPSLSYPAPTTNPYNKIGTKFSVLQLQLEKFEDYHDDQYSSDRSTTLHEIQDIFIDNGLLQDRDISSSNCTASISGQLVWEDYLITNTSKIKIVENIIKSSSGDVEYSCEENCNLPITYPQSLSFDSGINDKFIPNNLIIGDGQILNKDRSYYKVDFEVGTLILEIPDNFFGTEKSINIFSTFVSEYNNTGKTILGFKAMKFADCTYVQNSAIQNNQVKFSVSMQSFSPVLDGIDDDVEGIIVDPKMGVYIDSDTGILKLNFTNIYKSEAYKTLSTKVQINVFLKKAGFNNEVLSINPETVNNLFI